MDETVAAALRRGEERLAGTSAPRSDAEELLSRLLGLTWWQLRADPGRRLGPGESRRFDEWLARRVAGEPVQYVTGRAAFRDLDLAVDRRVLVPRPETEGLVERVLEVLREERARWPAPRVLDLGTGSGAIALAIASEWPAATVTALDASGGALEVARANARALGLEARVRFIAGRWLEAVVGERFEAIVSNPPYVAEHEWEGLPLEVRGFEPRDALLSGPEGLDDTRAIVASTPGALAPRGLLALEADETRAEKVAAEIRSGLGWRHVRVLPDLSGRPRYVLARRA